MLSQKQTTDLWSKRVAADVDAFGQEVKSTLLCLEIDGKSSMLPSKQDGYEIFVQQKNTLRCVKPKTCLKGTSRNFFANAKFAIPCDDDVPFAIACWGIVCAGKSPAFKTPAWFGAPGSGFEKIVAKGAPPAPIADEMAR